MFLLYKFNHLVACTYHYNIITLTAGAPLCDRSVIGRCRFLRKTYGLSRMVVSFIALWCLTVAIPFVYRYIEWSLLQEHSLRGHPFRKGKNSWPNYVHHQSVSWMHVILPLTKGHLSNMDRRPALFQRCSAPIGGRGRGKGGGGEGGYCNWDR